jgi:hypothetical protein
MAAPPKWKGAGYGGSPDKPQTRQEKQMTQSTKNTQAEQQIDKLIFEKAELLRKLHHEMENVKMLERAVAQYQEIIHHMVDSICPKVK